MTFLFFINRFRIVYVSDNKREGGNEMAGKWLKISVLIMAFVFILTGCSNESGGEAGASSDQTEITLGFYSSGSADEKMNELIEKFEEEHPDIKVNTQNAPYQQFFQKLDTQIAGGTAPDVWLSDGVFVQKYAERGAAKDLTEWINEDLNKDEYYGLDFNKDADGKYWGVPQGIQIGALFYNKDMFDQAGVDYPDENWTWEDLKEAGAKLTMDTAVKSRRCFVQSG